MRAQDKGLFNIRNIFVLFIDNRVLLTKGNFSKFLDQDETFGEFFVNGNRVRGTPHGLACGRLCVLRQ